MSVETEKLALIEILLNVDEEEILLKIRELLNQNVAASSISEEHKEILNERLEKHSMHPDEEKKLNRFQKRN